MIKIDFQNIVRIVTLKKRGGMWDYIIGVVLALPVTILTIYKIIEKHYLVKKLKKEFTNEFIKDKSSFENWKGWLIVEKIFKYFMYMNGVAAMFYLTYLIFQIRFMTDQLLINKYIAISLLNTFFISLTIFALNLLNDIKVYRYIDRRMKLQAMMIDQIIDKSGIKFECPIDYENKKERNLK